MRWMTLLRLRLRTLFQPGAVEREMEEELRYHLDRQEEARQSEAHPEAIRRSAYGIESRKDECRDARGFRALDDLLRDTRFAARQLRRNPGFTAAATVTLALGIAAAVAIFAYVDAALLQPLPYRDPGQLVAVAEKSATLERSNLSYQDYIDWKRTSTVFASFEAYRQRGFLMRTSGGTEPVRAASVSAGFFKTLGVRPALGRDLSATDERPDTPPAVLLTHGAWQRRFGGDKNIVGRTLLLSGIAHTVIGVLPQSFQFAPLGRAEFWTALNGVGACEKRRSCHSLFAVARLAPGVSLQAALANVAAIAKQLEEQYPDSNRGQGASVFPLTKIITGDIRPILLTLLVGAGLLLAIAFINVASLLLVRAENRRREMAIRGALGASAPRLLGQFITEGFGLAAGGSALGLLGASLLIPFLIQLVPADVLAGMPFLAGVSLNRRVLTFAAAVWIVAALLFAFSPAIQSTWSRMRDGLAEGSRGSAGLAWRRLGAKLIIVEFATAMVLLAGAGLLGKSLYRLMHVDVGFRPDHLAALSVDAPDADYPTDEQSAHFARSVISRVEALPGVRAVGIVNNLPVSFNGNTQWIRFVGRPYNGEHNEVNARSVSPGYFPTIGAKLLSGRFFDERDDRSRPLVLIINRTLAERYYPGQNPIGQQIARTSLDVNTFKRVVGVIDDVREGALDSEIWPAIYVPFDQDSSTSFSLVARTWNDPGAVLPQMGAAIRSFTPNVGISEETTVTDRIYDSEPAYIHRSSAWLVASFAGLALVLGVVGLYGVVAYSVSLRTREIGVRMAIGAEPQSVRRMVLAEAARLVAIATVLGIAASLGATSALRGVFFGIASWDPSTLAAVTVVLAGSALLASYIPARRAASVNPVAALRAE